MLFYKIWCSISPSEYVYFCYTAEVIAVNRCGKRIFAVRYCRLFVRFSEVKQVGRIKEQTQLISLNVSGAEFRFLWTIGCDNMQLESSEIHSNWYRRSIHVISSPCHWVDTCDVSHSKTFLIQNRVAYCILFQFLISENLNFTPVSKKYRIKRNKLFLGKMCEEN